MKTPEGSNWNAKQNKYGLMTNHGIRRFLSVFLMAEPLVYYLFNQTAVRAVPEWWTESCCRVLSIAPEQSFKDNSPTIEIWGGNLLFIYLQVLYSKLLKQLLATKTLLQNALRKVNTILQVLYFLQNSHMSIGSPQLTMATGTKISMLSNAVVKYD